MLSGTSVWRPQSRYTVSRIECRIKSPAESEMSRHNRATPRQIKVSHLSPPPPVAHSSHSQQATGRGGLVEGIAALLGSENGSRYRGVSQLQSHQPRYSVQLRIGVFDARSKFLPTIFCTTQTLLCSVAPVQEAFGALVPNDLLHTLLTTFGNFPFSGPLPERLGRNTSFDFTEAPNSWT